MERVQVTYYLIAVDQKISDCLVKIRFLEEVETAFR